MKLYKIQFYLETQIDRLRYAPKSCLRKLDMLKFNLGMKIYDLGKRVGDIPRESLPLKAKILLINIEHQIRMLGLKIS